MLGDRYFNRDTFSVLWEVSLAFIACPQPVFSPLPLIVEYLMSSPMKEKEMNALILKPFPFPHFHSFFFLEGMSSAYN